MKELNIQEIAAVSGGISPTLSACAVAFTVISLTIASAFHDQTESLKNLTPQGLFKK